MSEKTPTVRKTSSLGYRDIARENCCVLGMNFFNVKQEEKSMYQVHILLRRKNYNSKVQIYNNTYYCLVKRSCARTKYGVINRPSCSLSLEPCPIGTERPAHFLTEHHQNTTPLPHPPPPSILYCRALSRELNRPERLHVLFKLFFFPPL